MATDITKVDGYTVSGKFDVSASIKPDADSNESKTFTLRFNMDSVPLKDVITKALSPATIAWQRQGREKFDTLKDRSVIEVDFTSPGKKVKTREEVIQEYKIAFMKAGLSESKAIELATKAVDNPEVIE